MNKYEFIFNKKSKRDNENIYYWIYAKKCGVKFRSVFKNNNHIKDKSCLLMDHTHAPNPIKNEIKIIIKVNEA